MDIGCDCDGFWGVLRWCVVGMGVVLMVARIDGSVLKTKIIIKNPAYGRHQISQPMRIEAPIPIKYAFCITK